MAATSPETAEGQGARTGRAEPVRMAVLVSGSGTNLQSLLDHFNGRSSPIARVVFVMASRPGIGALDRARAAGVPAEVIDAREMGSEAAEGRMAASLDAHRTELIVLAGFLKLVPVSIVTRYSGRILNIHPALLPSFGGPGMYGARVHEAVIASGARVSGASVHLVDERYDEGRILAQWPVPVRRDDTPASLAARVLRVEHLLLPATIEALVGGEGGGAAGCESFRLSELGPPIDEIRKLL